MKVLNFMTGFAWASLVDPKGWAEVSVCGETFWIDQCKEYLIGDERAVQGTIANHLVNTDRHGLVRGEEVVFAPTLDDDVDT